MMIRPENIYRLIAGLLIIGLAWGCARPPANNQEQPTEAGGAVTDERGFDPLELPADRTVVPKSSVRDGVLSGKQALVDASEPAATDSASIRLVLPAVEIDTLNSQAYRVQLFTGRVYGLARQAARVAEEIFDQPVYVDYEVPNYKVRVGNFADRDAATNYQQMARTAGYSNAWVVMVKVAVKEAAPLYDNLTAPLLPPSELPADTTQTPSGEEGGGDSDN